MALQLLGSSLEIQTREHSMSSFSTYLIGFIILIIGLAIAAVLVGVSQTWVVVGCIVLIGIAILMATTRTKPKDPPVPPVA
jgi:positive regulator of sigma E activity